MKYIYNHLGSKAVEVDSVGNIINYVQYSPFGDHTSTLLSAGGVRKYDYEIGRFTSVDPLWEKYTGWTGYQYSLNNPVNLVDRNGKNPGLALPYLAGITVSEGLTLAGAVFGIPALAYFGDDLKQGLNDFVSSLNPPIENPVLSNPMGQDATTTNVNMSNAEQKLERQMAKQDKKLPESQGKKPDGGNKEVFEALKRSLAGSYGVRKAAEILQDKSIQQQLHEFQKQFKGVQNVAKEKIPEVVKEFRDLIGK